jgi:hypothetical protein
MDSQMSVFMAAGFEESWLQRNFNKYGPSLWQLLSLAISMGLSKEFVIEAVNKFHPLIVQVILDILGAQSQALVLAGPRLSAPMDGAIFDGLPTGLLDGPLVEILLQKLSELLPTLLSGWQLLLAQAALKAILDKIKKK